MELGDLRRDYRRDSLDESTVAEDPFEQFARWFNDAQSAGIAEPNAMTLATADSAGRPSARIVLLKGVSGGGFVFFTDYRSRKGRDLADNPIAALVFHWPPLERQVRVTGRVERTSHEESAAYFHSRPPGSRLGAWASEQSSPLTSREELNTKVAERRSEFGDDIPLPPHWGGFRLIPDTIEFWQGRPDRLHDRILYTRTSEHGWDRVRLSP
jgi:pyridoxamine 5'-phosphate oxidase